MASKQTKELASDARTQLRLNHAIKIAKRSTMRAYQTGAVIYDRLDNEGQMLAHGWSHSSVKGFELYPRSIHAELHAILRTSQRKDLQGATMYVATFRPKSKNITTGKPCVPCLALLLEVGIRHLYYTYKDASWAYADLNLFTNNTVEKLP